MIKNLQVENYALIKTLDISFEEGFTVITGETGAGKSIILGAVGLVLGNRADTSVLQDTGKKCIVEGTFSLYGQNLEDTFERFQLDYYDTTTFRREISPQGRSRAFINDTPVSLEIMKELSEKLINIHSQHQNLLIGNSFFQFNVVDSYCNNIAKVNEYRNLYKEYQVLRNTLQGLEAEEAKHKTDLDYYRFQHDELQRAGLDQEQFEQLEQELEILQNSEEIKLVFEKSAHLLANSESSILEKLREVTNLVKEVSYFSEEYKSLHSRLDTILIETKDLSIEIERAAQKVVYNPTLIQQLQAKVDLTNKLLLKHGAPNVGQLVEIRESFLHKIEGINSLDEKISILRLEIGKSEEKLKILASHISHKRQKAKKGIEESITGLLHKLAMPGACFRVKMEALNQFTINGTDRIEFFFSANPGSEAREVSKVASGGEVSRLMLGIKSIISQRNLLPTIIFDEIDSGISGETANKVSAILEAISKNIQVIAITHLPQIASRGKKHLLVSKAIENNRATTKILEIKDDERITEIAKMLGGKSPTQAMIATARELINN